MQGWLQGCYEASGGGHEAGTRGALYNTRCACTQHALCGVAALGCCPAGRRRRNCTIVRLRLPTSHGRQLGACGRVRAGRCGGHGAGAWRARAGAAARGHHHPPSSDVRFCTSACTCMICCLHAGTPVAAAGQSEAPQARARACQQVQLAPAAAAQPSTPQRSPRRSMRAPHAPPPAAAPPPLLPTRCARSRLAPGS